MGADDLVTQVARASATMILTLLNWENSVPRMLRVNENTFADADAVTPIWCQGICSQYEDTGQPSCIKHAQS